MRGNPVADPKSYGNVVLAAPYGYAQNITISDLVVDCNALTIIAADYTKPWMLQGIALWGTGNILVERVHVINATGYYYAIPPESVSPTAKPARIWLFGDIA